MSVLRVLGSLSFALLLAGAAPARADLSGEWLTSSGKLVFESRGEGRYHAVFSFAGALPGQVPIELQGSLKGLVFAGRWISHWTTANGSVDCGVERNSSPHWGWIRLEFDRDLRRFSGLRGRCEEARPSSNWLGRRALTGDETELTGYGDSTRAALAAFPVASDGPCQVTDRFGLAVHGGAHSSRGNNDSSRALIKRVLLRGEALLKGGGTALDAVEWSIRTLEDSGLFGAGRGATANRAGVVELDASIMEGRSRNAGAVAAVTATKNPITGARLVMERTGQVLMVGPGADRRVAELGAETVPQDYFHGTSEDFRSLVLPADLAIEAPAPGLPEARARFSGVWVGRIFGYRDVALVVERIDPAAAEVVYAMGEAPDWGHIFGGWSRATAAWSDARLAFALPGNRGHRFALALTDPDTMELSYRNDRGAEETLILTRWTGAALPGQLGTVGAVALDRCGDLAAGTSTAGYGSKPPGRVGDSPIIGAGTYADNATAAISATGHGEYFIRFAAAHDIAAMMEYSGASLEEAASHVIKKKLFARGLSGGVIAIDRKGNIAMPFNTEFMLRGAVGNDRPASVAYE